MCLIEVLLFSFIVVNYQLSAPNSAIFKSITNYRYSEHYIKIE